MLDLAADWYDPDRGRMMVENFVSTLNDVAVILHVPSWAQMWTAGHAASQDCARATQSSLYFLYLMGQPIVRSCGWILFWAGRFVYKYIFIEAIYNHGLAQTKEVAISLWKWQCSLTREQLLWEAAIVLLLPLLYRLHQFLERRKYLRKASTWIHRKQNKLQQIYKEGLRRIARISLVFAAMTSHILFLSSAAALRFFFPRLAIKAANPNFISLFAFYSPVFFTVTALFQYQQQKEEEEREIAKNLNKNKRNSTTINKSQAARKRKWSVDGGNSFIPNSEESLEDELQDWLRFWMVRANVEALKCLLAWATPTWFVSILLQLELLFYVWIYCLPFIQPGAIAGIALPEGRPLRVLCSYLGPYSRAVVDKMSAAIPQAFWQNRVVAFVAQVSGALVLVRVLKQSTSEWLLHMVQEGRGLVIPALTLATPGFLTRYGVVYVQYILSTANSYSDRPSMRKTTLWLQYWVVHALVDAVLFRFSSILWWIPFSTHATFCLWCYLSLPKTIENWYHAVQSELKLFGLLPGHHEGDFEQTKTARFLTVLWEILPKAKDEKEGTTLPPTQQEGPTQQTTSPTQQEGPTQEAARQCLPATALYVDVDSEGTFEGLAVTTHSPQNDIALVGTSYSDETGSPHSSQNDIVRVTTSMASEDENNEDEVGPVESYDELQTLSSESAEKDSADGNYNRNDFTHSTVHKNVEAIPPTRMMTRAAKRREERRQRQ